MDGQLPIKTTSMCMVMFSCGLDKDAIGVALARGCNFLRGKMMENYLFDKFSMWNDIVSAFISRCVNIYQSEMGNDLQWIEFSMRRFRLMEMTSWQRIWNTKIDDRNQSQIVDFVLRAFLSASGHIDDLVQNMKLFIIEFDDFVVFFAVNLVAHIICTEANASFRISFEE